MQKEPTECLHTLKILNICCLHLTKLPPGGGLITKSCPVFWDPLDCSQPGSSAYGILHARIMESVSISFSRWTSWHRDQTQASCIAGIFFTHWAMREAQLPPSSYAVYLWYSAIVLPCVAKQTFLDIFLLFLFMIISGWFVYLNPTY